MSATIIALIIPFAAVAIAFVWVPLLNFICPPCVRPFQRDALKAWTAMGSIRD
jgi:hypothetical protein